MKTNFIQKLLLFTLVFALPGCKPKVKDMLLADLRMLNPKATILNLHNNGLVETGFLIGTASVNTPVGVSLDGGAISFATMTSATSWSFKLPTGSSTWRVGSLHTIRVSYGVYVDTIRVRKGTNKDVNGDGYVDTIVGAYGYGTNTGRAYIFHSSANGIASQAVTAANTILTGEVANSNFGVRVALGDANGDGYADAIVGANAHNTNIGRAYIFHSSGASGIATQAATAANTILTGNSLVGGYFGNWVALGDVNGDGYADAIVGAYADNSGRAYIFHSSGATGIASQAATAANTILNGEAANSNFGAVVTLGDVNGDGYADAIVGSSGYNPGTANTGRAYIFHSSASGIATQAATTANTILTGEALATGSWFGYSVFLGDVNGDGYADAIVGAYTYDPGGATNTGRVYIFHSSANGIATQATIAATANTILTGETGAASAFGFPVTLGDVNGDGYADAIVGAYSYGAGTGRAYIFHSSANGIATQATIATTANTILTGETGANVFGYSIALGDVNGDGYADAIIGANAYAAGGNTGRVYIHHSSASGIATNAATAANTILTGETAGGLFGNSLAFGNVIGEMRYHFDIVSQAVMLRQMCSI